MAPAVEVWGLGHWSTDWLSARFGTVLAIGVTLFVIGVVTVIICCTCSCCCLYKMCRRPRREHPPLPHGDPLGAAQTRAVWWARQGPGWPELEGGVASLALLTGALFAAVVTTTMATTVTHTPYLQPPSYPGPTYQGYHSVVPQPGLPTAPYPTQPMGPPAYHETMAGEYACRLHHA